MVLLLSMSSEAVLPAVGDGHFLGDSVCWSRRRKQSPNLLLLPCRRPGQPGAAVRRVRGGRGEGRGEPARPQRTYHLSVTVPIDCRRPHQHQPDSHLNIPLRGRGVRRRPSAPDLLSIGQGREAPALGRAAGKRRFWSQVMGENGQQGGVGCAR